MLSFMPACSQADMGSVGLAESLPPAQPAVERDSAEPCCGEDSEPALQGEDGEEETTEEEEPCDLLPAPQERPEWVGS